jgi:hypothetical protein
MRSKSEVTLVVVLVVVVVFTAVGWAVTPINEKGQPVLLLPDVKKVEEYRSKAANWTEEFRILDGRIASLMSGNSRSLYSQSKSSQDLFEDFVKLAQEIQNTEAPASLTGLKDSLLTTSDSYLNAGQAALKWVSNPTTENYDLAQTLIDLAQESLSELEGNTWITTTN